MRCPRRDEVSIGVFSLGSVFPKEDSWGPDDHCSWCGSLNPETLMERLRRGDVELIPCDKSYKVYVRNVAGESFGTHFRDCYERNADGSSGGRKQPECTGPDDCSHWTVQATERTKFYFQHFDSGQQREFVEMINRGKLRIGEPGHFYVRPFFCVPSTLRTRAADIRKGK